MNFKYITSIAACFTLLGCSVETPKCSDEATVALVKKIIAEKFQNGENYSTQEVNKHLKLEFPRANSFDEKIKKYTCEAKLIAGDKYEVPIEYESQVGDDNRHLVYFKGMLPRDFIFVEAGFVEGIKNSNQINTPNSKNLSPLAEDPPTQKIQIAEIPRQEESALQPNEMATQERRGEADKVGQIFKPSFNCDKASSYVEKSICNESTLGQLDGALSQNYKNMLSANIDDESIKNLRQTQREWIAERNLCQDNNCLIERYKDRLNEICEIPVNSGIHPICITADEII